MITEAVQQRNETRKRLWEHYNSMPHPEVWWSISNLEKLIMHLDDYLLKAEALRQSGCFDESLRLLGKPEDFSSAFGQLRHAARVIYELAQCGYRFLWFSIGEEDFSTHEIVEQSRRINLNNRAPQNRQILKDAASPRDLIFCREAVQFRMDLDKPDFFVGKSHEQILRMMRYPNCPTCQCRFLWNGNRCGECDPTVFENGPPNSFQSDQLQIELLRSRQPGDS